MGRRGRLSTTTGWSPPTAPYVPVEVRSMVGIIPLLAAMVVDEAGARAGPDGSASTSRGSSSREGLHDREELAEAGLLRGEPGDRAAAARRRAASTSCGRIFAKLFDEAEFLSPYGLRAMSAYHREHPYVLDVDGHAARRSTTSPPSRPPTCSAATRTGAGRCGSRSTTCSSARWSATTAFFGDDFTVEYPTGRAGSCRSTRRRRRPAATADLDLPGGPRRARPCFGWVDRLQTRSGLEGQHPVPRVLPRRQRRRPGRLAPDGLDRRSWPT